MIPEQAQRRLAAAHKTMTPDQIATHALLLAGLLANFDTTAAGLHQSFNGTIDRANGSLDMLKKLQPLVTDIVRSLGNNDTLRAFQIATGINSILAAYAVVDPLQHLPPAPTIETACPDIFDPKVVE